MKKILFGGVVALVMVTALVINVSLIKSELSPLSIANIEALAINELPEVEIVCNGGDYGMCQYCRRYEVYHSYYGYGWAYECVKTGDQDDGVQVLAIAMEEVLSLVS